MVRNLIVLLVLFTLFLGCRQEFLSDGEKKVETCNITGKWVLCFDKLYDYDLELCDDPDYLKTLPVWDFREDGSLIIGGVTGYKYSVTCPIVKLDIPNNSLGVEAKIVSLELNEMIWEDNFFCTGQCYFVRLDPIPEPMDTSGSTIQEMYCPNGIEVNCEEAIYEAWYWVNSPKTVYYEEFDMPIIRFGKNSSSYSGRNGAPSGAYFEMSDDCTSMNILNRFGTYLRTVKIVGLNQNVLVLNDPTVYIDRNLVFVKFWNQDNNEVEDNIDLISKFYCQNHQCDECAFGFCSCSEGGGFDCLNAIEDHHVYNYDQFKHSEIAVDGNILIAFLAAFGQSNAMGIMKVNANTMEQMWVQTFDFETSSIYNSFSSSDIIHQSSDGSIFIAGRNTMDRPNTFHLVKLNQQGIVIFHHQEEFEVNTDVISIRSLDDDGFIVLTKQNYFKEGFLRRYNAAGDLLWINKDVDSDLQTIVSLDYIFVNDEEIHVFGDDFLAQTDGAIYHSVYNSNGVRLLKEELDFISPYFDSKGEAGVKEPTIVDINKIGDRYLIYLLNASFDFMSDSRIDHDYCVFVTDLDFQVQSVNLIPKTAHAGTVHYSYTLTDSGELAYCIENRDENIVMMRFDISGNLKYVTEFKFSQYKDLLVGGLHQISPTSFIITGHGKRFGQDVITIRFDEGSVSNNQFDCQF